MNQLEIIQYLLDTWRGQGALTPHLLTKDLDGNTTLHRSALRGNANVVNCLLKAGDAAAMCSERNNNDATTLISVFAEWNCDYENANSEKKSEFNWPHYHLMLRKMLRALILPSREAPSNSSKYSMNHDISWKFTAGTPLCLLKSANSMKLPKSCRKNFNQVLSKILSLRDTPRLSALPQNGLLIPPRLRCLFQRMA